MPLPQNGLEKLDQEALAQAQAIVGVPLRRIQHNRLASSPAINRWAKSIGDRNPLWLDADYGASSALAQTVAPPCWLYSVDDTCLAPKLPGFHVIYGGAEWEFYRWVGLGEEIVARCRLTKVEEKKGRFCGPMVLQTGETLFTDQQSRPVARAVSRVLRTPRPAAVAAGKYRDWTKHAYSQEVARSIEDAYDAEEVRGGRPRYWEQVDAGQRLPPIVRGPLTSEEIVQFICATRPSLGFRSFLRHRKRHPDAAFLDPETGSWESWEASMLRDEVASMFGFPFAHDAGIDRISWVGNLITNWMSDRGFLKSLAVTLTLPNVYGDATWCHGLVRRVYQQDDQHLVDLEVWCENQRGQRTAQGVATVVLPLGPSAEGGHQPTLLHADQGEPADKQAAGRHG